MNSFLCLCLLVSCAAFVQAGLQDHKYTDGEQVILWSNKVGPYRNPQETYSYFSLPYCRPNNTSEDENPHGISDMLQGYELKNTGFDIQFKESKPRTVLCETTLNEADFAKLKSAVEEMYWYQMFLDDLPLWGMVGDSMISGSETKHYLYTHRDLSLSYNGNRIISVNLTSEGPVLLEAGAKLVFTYKVTWTATSTDFDDRFDRYLDDQFFEHQIHWFSIFNSFMMGVFLSGLVAMILLRTLRKDYAKFEREDLEDTTAGSQEEDSGWKQVHGDVFRAPPHLGVLAALIGTGYHIISLLSLVLFMCMVNYFYKHRGVIMYAIIMCYAFTSFIGGYGGGGFYARNGGRNWIRVMLISSVLYPAINLVIFLVMDMVAVSYGSLNSLPISAMVFVACLWAFVSFPLTIAGTILGRNFSGTADRIPCRVNQVPRQIPERPWFARRELQIILGGMLPFGCIFIEIYFVFTSVWHYKFYYIYGVLMIVFLLLVIVTVCTNVVSTYFLLNWEDYRWHWHSYWSGASTSLYIILYSIYYYFNKTEMTGALQATFYFGYMLMFSLTVGLVCGAIAYVASSVFVRRIYRNIKVD
eukprot:CAMPEP_0177630598 /NCGR_PEP_ID=MMETSP0447-20121125/1296_1 /TAXON_ID=0 /ORGANISM="Stygamoeba regulata, Strain BSH-02190019" /LENGTH=583 /DNA_ID=CAMNT_0019132015 /DNA_START=146 /DNA_END=1897 /DNA_ORIENTATION=-